MSRLSVRYTFVRIVKDFETSHNDIIKREGVQLSHSFISDITFFSKGKWINRAYNNHISNW